MYAGTKYGSLMKHPIVAYHLNARPHSGFAGIPSGMGFSQLALPAAAATGPAAPFVAAALIVAPFMLKLLAGTIKGCGDSCVLTSDAANEVERLLQKNLAMYQSSGHTKAEQQAALAYFDLVWNQLVEFCGQPQFQSTKAGRNCVEDRRAGACKWKNGTECWNWFIGYRDPIANDPDVKPDAASPISSSSLFPSSDSSNENQSLIQIDGKEVSPLLLIAALVALVVIAS